MALETFSMGSFVLIEETIRLLLIASYKHPTDPQYVRLLQHPEL